MKSLKMIAFSIFVLMFVGTSLYAQGIGGSAGTLAGVVRDENGAPLPGVLVTLSGAAATKTATTDVDGRFIFPYVTPGTYDVRSELQSYTTIEQSDVEIRLGQRTEITFNMKPGQEELVVVTGEAPVVDVSSTTTGANISSELLSSIPVGRGFATAINLAPGTTDSGIAGGNLSISGASGLENTYIIDGVNITDPGYGAVGSYSIVFGSLGSGFNQDMVKEIQVKSGGFEPEYGQALGGVVNVITKSGGNEFAGEGYAYFQPGSLEGDRDYLFFQDILSVNVAEDESVDGGVNISGPIVKDKLFFFGAYNPRRIERSFDNDPDAARFADFPSATRQRTVQSYSLKATANATANHSFEVSVFGDPSKGELGFQRASGLASLNPEFQQTELDYGSNSQIGRWTGILRPNMFVEASVARAANHFDEIFPESSNKYSVTDRTTLIRFAKGGPGFFENSEAKNIQFGVKATNIWSGHEVRYGVQFEDIDYLGGAQYSGPRYTAFNGQQTTSGALVSEFLGSRFGLPADRVFVVSRNRLSASPVPTSTRYLNLFVQDSWNVTSYLNVKGGVRWEKQQIKGDRDTILPDTGETISSEDITLTNNIAPRLGATYDYLRNGKSKLYGHYGRFYEKIPNDLAVRALISEISSTGFYYFLDPTLSGYIEGTGHISGSAPTEVEGLGKSESPFETKSQYSNEFIVGIEQEVAGALSVGGRFIYRDIARVLEDIQIDLTSPCVPYADVDSSLCVAPGMVADPGFFLSNSSAYFITNMDGHYPGYPVSLTRDYRAFELTAEKRLSNNWQLLGNYRFAKLEGNYEGLFRRDNGQSDPNITSLGDFAACFARPDGSCVTSEFIGFTYDEGPLPNDQKHMIKIYGSYQWGMGLNTGMAFNWHSGNPVTKLGAIPFYGSSERLLTTRGALGRTDSLTTLDLHADYGFNLGGGDSRLTLAVDVFNIFNSQDVITVDQRSQIDNRTFSADANRDFLAPTLLQDPRQVRFGIKFGF